MGLQINIKDFEVKKDKKNFLIHGNEELGKEYDRVLSFFDVDGKVAYTATKDANSFVVYDGQVIWEGSAWGKDTNLWQGVWYIFDIGGKPAFPVREYIPESRKRIEYVLFDGKEIGGRYESVAAGGRLIKEINGKLAFTAKKEGKTFVVYDGKEFGKEYETASAPFDFEGKFAFFASKNEKVFIVVQK